MFFEDLHNESKVWIYTSDRELTAVEVDLLQKEANTFVKDWAAHGAGLKARALVYKNRFLILAVDETNVHASGCSIDSSVKFIKTIGNQLNVNFFDRMNLMVDNGSDSLQSVHISDLKNHLNDKVFNPMITSLSELRNEWLIPVDQSPFV